jgi:hypothetical protein
VVYDPNAPWTAAIDDNPQAPHYFVRIDGLTSVQYSTHPIKTTTRTTKTLLELPVASRGIIDLQNGSSTTLSVDFTILDDLGEMADLIAWTRTSPTVGTLINRKIELFGGYAHMTEAQYPPIFTGRISGVSMTTDMTGFKFTALDFTTQFDQNIMLNAEVGKPSKIVGNLINCVWSLLSGTFDEGHATFPLDHASVATTTTSAPTGLGIPSAELNETLFVSERDRWFPEADVHIEYDLPVDARSEIEVQFLRAFAMFVFIQGDGKIGFKHRMPVLPVTAANTLTKKDDIIEVTNWRRRLDLHANKFRVNGGKDRSDGSAVVLYDEDTPSDTADRTATGLTIDMTIQSNWMRTTLNGAILAAVMASRNRFLFQSTPATFTASVLFSRRNVELGDTLKLTHESLPDLLTGDRGVTDQAFLVIGRQPNFEKGVIELDLLDTRYLRYGIWGPDTLPDYGSATQAQKDLYTFVGDSTDSNRVGSTPDEGYRIV